MSRTGEDDAGIVVLSAGGATLDPDRYGRKAAGLQDLLRFGLRVPPAVCVPIEAAAEIANGVEMEVATELFAGLKDLLGDLPAGRDDANARFAVRGGAAISLPGAFETVLDVAPDDVAEAIATVVASTRGRRVETIVRAMGIDEVPPTAAIVQRQIDTMGDERSGAGVATSRDPVTGAERLRGSIAWRQRGDAVMAGTIPVDSISSVERRCPDVAAQLRADCARLEGTLGTPVEVEFAIGRGELWYLQLRPFDLPTNEPADAPPTAGEIAGRGRPASPGVATGELHTDVDDALDAIEAGRSVIIALQTSSPGDVPVMVRAAGVMTVLGNPESHAAVVTRSARVPAVVSVQGLTITEAGIEIDGHTIAIGEAVTVDGTRGQVVIA